ncbi:MAG: hypothetical protein EBR82_64720, partial [Caulobacteraceae bacterium]|nr:hypothetical protein [Caulobacteraceae bacterium]
AQKKSSLEALQNLNPAELKMLIAGMMGGIELGKYDGIDFTPPQGARDAAKRALDVREGKPASQKGMTPVGIARARDLMNGVKLSPDTIRRMKAFFDRHEVDKKGATWDEQGKGWQAWNGWGGDAGYAWARKVVRQMESRDKELSTNSDSKELAEEDSCPIATQDIKVNLKNRQTAVDDANYGPANPNESNEDYWKAKADEFQGDIATAKKMLCGNCAAFDQRTKTLNCIKQGIGEDANEVALAGDLGYCEIFDFKCAAKRTCDAWIVGGPMTDKSTKKTEFVAGRDCGQDPEGTFGPDNKCAVGYGRPPLKGGYEPKRPGGKFPKDYKRPTPQKDEAKKPSPPKPPPPPPLPPKPKEQTEKQKQISKISDKFREDGIISVLPENLEQAQEIERSYSNLKAKGYSIPPPEQILTAELDNIYKDASFAKAYACADTATNGDARIIFNKRYEGENVNAKLEKDTKNNWLATKDIFAHEYAHNAHMRSLGEETTLKYVREKFGTGEDAQSQIRIAGKVSSYAATDPLEFVSETFAGHVNGKKYDDDVYELYKRYNGPELK